MPGFLHEAPGIEARVRAVSQVLSHRLALVGGEDTPSVWGERGHVGAVAGSQSLQVIIARITPVSWTEDVRGEREREPRVA